MIFLRSNACLREQIGGKGYFADVSVSAEITDAAQSGLAATFSDCVSNEWVEAASVGLRIGWRCLSQKNKHCKNIDVRVNSIITHPVDTTEIVVMYVAAKALTLLFNEEPQSSPVFVKEFGVFLFGKS